MSWRVVSQVALVKGITAPERVVLLGMAHLAQHDGKLAGLNMKQLAGWCDMSERGVRGIIRRLEEKGLLTCHESRGRGHSNSYAMTLPEATETGTVAPVMAGETGTEVPINEVGKPEQDGPETGMLVPIKSLKPEREAPKTGTAVPPNCRTVSKREANASHISLSGDPFSAFWAAYPRRVSKAGAEKKFRALVKSGIDPGRIIEGARRYAAERAGQDQQFTKHPTTWLTNGCWDDEPTPITSETGGSDARRPAETAYDRRKRDREEAESAERAEAERLARFYGASA